VFIGTYEVTDGFKRKSYGFLDSTPVKIVDPEWCHCECVGHRPSKIARYDWFFVSVPVPAIVKGCYIYLRGLELHATECGEIRAWRRALHALYNGGCLVVGTENVRAWRRDLEQSDLVMVCL